MLPANIALDPATQRFLSFLEQLKRPQVFEVPVEEARAMYVKGQDIFPVAKLPAQVEDRTVHAGPKGVVRMRVFKPKGAGTGLPVLMYFHGGGWVLGTAETYDRFMRELTHGTGAAVVFVEYSLAPEERYPVPLEECYAATQWISEHGAELGLDGGRMAVAGDSAGGNMAAAACLLGKERGGPLIAGQVLVYPATAAGFDTPSFHEFAQGYFLTAEASRWFWHQYAPDRATDRDPHACPLLATPEQLKEMPPALIITAECDILRDEGEAYARKLMQVGVPVTCTRYLGAIHGFMGLNALTESAPAKAATAQMNNWLSHCLGICNTAAAP